MRVFVVLVGIAIGSTSSLAAAQDAPDFSSLDVKVGEKIYVTDMTTGVEVSGPLTALTQTQLGINGHVFAPAPALKIEKAGDPIWDGALIGAGIGTLSGLTIGSEACLHRSLWPCAVSGAVSWGLIGVLVDSLHHGRTRIYRSPSNPPPASVRLVPLVDPRQKSIALAFALR
jgi:hypothetical protein